MVGRTGPVPKNIPKNQVHLLNLLLNNYHLYEVEEVEVEVEVVPSAAPYPH